MIDWYWTSTDHLRVVTELVSGPTLQQLLADGDSGLNMRDLETDLVRAVGYLHDKDVVIQSLTPHTVFYSNS